MTAAQVTRRVVGPRLRPDLAWQLRQGSALVYVIWFAVAVPLVIVGLLLEPRWVGWLVLAWFLVLVGFTLLLRIRTAGGARRGPMPPDSSAGGSARPGRSCWSVGRSHRSTLDPKAEVVDVTTGQPSGPGVLDRAVPAQGTAP